MATHRPLTTILQSAFAVWSKTGEPLMPAILPNSGLLNSAVAMAQDGIRGRIASIAKLQVAIAYGDVARNDEGFLFQDAGDEQLVTRLAGGDGLIIYDASAHEKNL